MPIAYAEGLATLTGACTVEEAEPFLDWLRTTPEPAVDLAGCAAPHSAIVQLLLATGPRIAAPPPDPLLARALAPYLR
jgi:hypothetical protein